MGNFYKKNISKIFIETQERLFVSGHISNKTLLGRKQRVTLNQKKTNDYKSK